MRMIHQWKTVNNNSPNIISVGNFIYLYILNLAHGLHWKRVMSRQRSQQSENR